MNIAKSIKLIVSLLIVSILGCSTLFICVTGILIGLFRLDEDLHQHAQELALSNLPPLSTIEANYEDILGEIGNITQDTLLEDVVVSQLGVVSPEVYIGCIRGYRERVYGTRHDFNEVLALYANEFSVRKGWQQVNTDLDTASFSNQNTRLRLIAFPYNEDQYPLEWANYFTLYRLHIMYAEPSLAHCTG